MGRLDGRVAIVTGAGQGIGRAIALALGEEGALVTVADRNATRGEAVAQELRALGRPALAVPCDVTRRADVDRTVRETVDAHGGVDVLVNNAHDLRDVECSLLDTTEEHLRRNLDSGLLGALFFLQACHPHLRQGDGSVINIASPTGLAGSARFFSYAAAKEGLRAATRVAAREWGTDGIRVNAICPSAWDTPQMRSWLQERDDEEWMRAAVASVPLGRPGRAGDVASVAVFLASDDSGYMTGSTLVVDGGASMDAGR